MCWKGCPNPAALSNGYCRDCHNARGRVTKAKWGRRYWRYGITEEDTQAMWLMQGGRCDICRDRIDVLSAHVDHNHETQEVRALLCSSCNQGLGQFKDNQTLLQAAASFLGRMS